MFYRELTVGYLLALSLALFVKLEECLLVKLLVLDLLLWEQPASEVGFMTSQNFIILHFQ